MCVVLNWIYAILVVLGLFKSSAFGSFTDRRNLLQDLMSSYDKMLIPEVGPNKNVNVTHAIELLRIISLEDQILTLDTYVSITWTDNQLMWDPEQYGAITEISLPSEQIWRPDILLTNNADKFNGVHRADINAVVTYDGAVFYSPPVQISAFCNVPDQLERGDVITCSLGYTSWTYHSLLLDLRNRSDKMEIASESGRKFNKKWRLVSSKVERNEVQYKCCPESYINLQYTLNLKYSG